MQELQCTYVASYISRHATWWLIDHDAYEASSYIQYTSKKFTFCDCNYEVATIITPLLQIYVFSNYGAYGCVITLLKQFNKK